MNARSHNKNCSAIASITTSSIYEKNDINNDTSPSQLSSSEEEKEHDIKIADVLEEKGGVQTYMLNTNSSNEHFIRLYKLISDNLQNLRKNWKMTRF